MVSSQVLLFQGCWYCQFLNISNVLCYKIWVASWLSRHWGQALAQATFQTSLPYSGLQPHLLQCGLNPSFGKVAPLHSLSFLRYFLSALYSFFFLNNGPILFCLYIFNILYIYLAVPGLSYGTQDILFSLMACGIVAAKRKTEEWVFLFPFPESKEDKENSEQAWTFPVFFFT